MPRHHDSEFEPQMDADGHGLILKADTYARPGRYIIAVTGIDIFGHDTMSLVPVMVG